MQTLYYASRYVLPVVFVGFAGLSNYAFFAGKPELSHGSLLRGDVTASVDALYKKSLPHREPSIGLMGAVRYSLLGEGRKGVIVGDDGWLFTNEEARTASTSLDDPMTRIVAIRDQLAAAGTDLVIVPVPAKSDIYRDEAAHADMSNEMAATYTAFLTALGENGIPVVDTRPALLAERELARAYFTTDTHWTREGAAAVAQAIAASNLVATGADSFVPQDKDAATFTGDLVSYVTTDSLAPMLGLAPEHVVPMTAIPAVTPAVASAADIFAAPAAEVDIFGGAAAVDSVLVGTSYSANPNWSFAESLKIALSRDIINFAKEGQGPARPMMDYLASADFTAAPPATVIWEFPVRYLGDATIWDTDTGGASHDI